MTSRKSLCRYFLDILMPNSCPICEKAIKWDKLICENCMEELVPAHNEKREGLICDYFFSAFGYEGNCVKAVCNLKENYVYNFAEYTAQIIAENLEKSELKDKIDLVCAVPMNWKKKAERGYNQAEVIGNFLCKFLGKNKDYKLLKRTNDKILQHSLSAVERKIHAEKIYRINDAHRDISGKRILLCDDVVTTGATMNRCTFLLRQMGAKEVYCVSSASTTFEK